ncbi:transposase [Endozoicomonas gorgoniicola]|uniref:transposase n=1 Tax=Endozoicomonas gorgoniicola TaxID=1234144 RepID=UPI0038991617
MQHRVTGSMDRFAFVNFLKSLVRSVDKPVIVITDGHPAHKAKHTQEYVAQEPRLLDLHLLPGYSPELNPDEQVWNHLKEKLGKVALKTKDEFIKFIRGKMGSLQKSPETIKGFFRETGHLRTSTQTLHDSPCYSGIHHAGDHHGYRNKPTQTTQPKPVASPYHRTTKRYCHSVRVLPV